MDLRLQALADSAEREQPVPGVCLLVDGWLVQGTPVSTRHFLGLTHSNLNHLARSALGHRDEKALRAKLSEDQIWGLLSEQTLPLVAALETPNHGPAGGLNLAPVLLAGSFGDIETVGVRIPLTAINAWWVGSFRHIPRRTSGGGGVSVEF